ncbi:MAG TPA: TrkA C-terminal domain-containing protein, partial [Thermoleophilia bacterium]|nr:TrkA C-terminal domain-containing protein [Thermoleophilia bacterium]
VIVGDADEPSILYEAGVDRADVFVASTGDDEDNLVASLLAKNEYKVKKVIAAVRNPRNRWLYNRSWGVDVAIDSAEIVTKLIEEEATLADVVTLLDLHEGEVTVSSMTIAEGHWAAGKTMAQLGLPAGCVIAAVRNPRNRWLYNRSWGVDVAIDSAEIVTKLIEEEATLADVVTLLDLHEGEVTVSSMTINAGHWAAGKTLKQLGLPEGCVVAALLHDTQILMPKDETVIEAGDQLLIIAGPGAECTIREELA